MSGSNVWAEFANLLPGNPSRLCSTMIGAKAELKALVPEDAREALGAWGTGEALKVRRD